MPALKNTRHEAFARALAKGQSTTAAYVEAGYKESPAAATRLSKKVNIADRVAELVEAGAERAEIDIARTLKELVRLGTSDLRQAFTDNGSLKDPSTWSDDFAAAVSAVEVASRSLGKDEDGNTETEYVHKLKLWDKNSALEKIAKHLGMFIERVEHTGKDGERLIPEHSDEEIARRAAFLLAKGVQGRKPEGEEA